MTGKHFSMLILTLALSQCNNYDLLDKLESPGTLSGGRESFTSNYYIFVSSWTTLGAMGGSPFSECNALAAGPERADCACTRAAIGRGLRRSSSHVFRAWLSTASSDAKCRVQAQGNGCGTNFPGNWFNTIGQTIVSNFNGFESAGIASPIRFDEFGQDQGINEVWTGSEVGGTTVITPTPAHCDSWTLMTGPTGRLGMRTANDNLWTNNGNNDCSNSYRVYCVASPVF